MISVSSWSHWRSWTNTTLIHITVNKYYSHTRENSSCQNQNHLQSVSVFKSLQVESLTGKRSVAVRLPSSSENNCSQPNSDLTIQKNKDIHLSAETMINVNLRLCVSETTQLADRFFSSDGGWIFGARVQSTTIAVLTEVTVTQRFSVQGSLSTMALSLYLLYNHGIQRNLTPFTKSGPVRCSSFGSFFC